MQQGGQKRTPKTIGRIPDYYGDESTEHPRRCFSSPSLLLCSCASPFRPPLLRPYGLGHYKCEIGMKQ